MPANRNRQQPSPLVLTVQKGQSAMRTSVRVSLFYTLLVSLLLMLGMPLQAAPQLPSSFYGTVTVDGANVPDGTVITAWINDVLYDQTVTFSVDGVSVYTLDVRSDDPDTPDQVEGGVSGDTVIFKIGDLQAEQTGVWQGGSNTELNLSAVHETAIDVSAPESVMAPLNSEVVVPISISNDVTTRSILSYQFVFHYDENVLQFMEVEKADTLSANWIISYNNSPGEVQVAAYGTTALTGSGPLLNLLFQTSNSGGAQSNLDFASFKFNEGTPTAQTHNGSLLIGSLSIVGAVTYNPNSKPVSDVTLRASGVGTSTTTSGSDGSYQLTINAIGDYTVVPNKEGDHRGALSGLDASYILQCVVGVRVCNSYQTTVADVSQFDGVTAYDAALLARYLVGLLDPPSCAGQWTFSPSSRAYTPLDADLANQDYIANLCGDVTENWGEEATQARSTTDVGITVAHLPEVKASPGETIHVPLRLSGANDFDILAYELDLKFDGSVIELQEVSLGAAADSTWQLVTNIGLDGVSLVGFGVQPLQIEDDLIHFYFKVTGGEGDESPLVPERLRINEAIPTTPREAAGRIVIDAPKSNPNRLFLPYINSSSVVERERTLTIQGIYLPLVEQ